MLNRSRLQIGWCVVLLMTTLWASETLPETHGETFSGQQVAIPGSLRGKVGILVVSFSKKGGSVAASWGKRLGRDVGSDPRVAYYQLLMLGDLPGFVRGFVLRGIKSSIPSNEHNRFLPIYSDDRPWKQLVHFQDADDAYIIVLDKNLQITFRDHGALTDAGYLELSRKIASSLNQPGTPTR